MNRLLQLLTLVAALSFMGAASASEEIAPAETFVNGTDFVELADPRQTRAGEDEVEVIEFFWHGCPHCFAAEPYVQEWLQEKPDKVKFLRVPATLNRGWLLHARAYYTAERLGIANEMHDAMFDAIHRERKHLRSIDEIAELFEEKAGIGNDQFRQAFESFSVGNKLKQADTLARSYPLGGVPTIIVGGRYMTTAGMARGYERLLDVTRYLVSVELGELPRPEKQVMTPLASPVNETDAAEGQK